MDERVAIEPTVRVADVETQASRPAPARRELDARWIGRFAVLRKLGEGGMGAVYAAYDEQLERRVALKLLHDGDHARLLREAQALARLSHPHVVQIYEAGEFEGHVFVAMEYVEGPTLAAWLAAAPREVDEILEVFVQAGRGLAAAHERGLVHRDFKPGNVIVGDDGRVRVLDFGLARARESLATPRPTEPAAAPRTGDVGLLSSTLTRTGALVGTPAYMSPEQYAGLPIDARSDQFSFCAALYEGLYGQRPFGGETLLELSGNVIAGEVRPPPPRPDVAPAIAAAIVRGLAADPADRWPSIDELLAVLAGGRGQLVEDRARLVVLLFTTSLGAVALLVAHMLWERPYEAGPAQMAGFALVMLLVALAGLPWAYRRLHKPQQRVLIHFGLAMLTASLVVRVVFWRVGETAQVVGIAESITYAGMIAVGAVVMRAPWVLLAVLVMLAGPVLTIELGQSPQWVPVLWIASVPVALQGLRRRRAPA